MGEYDSIYGFAALGLSTFPVDNDREQCAAVFKRLTLGDYAIIYITESKAALIREEIAACSEKTVPAVILIPGISGNTGEGLAQVKRSVEKAVGSDIIFNQ